jgi:xanthine dehydrogenase accessory factor
MIIYPDGKTAGSIGGGCVEAEVWQETRKVFRRAEPRLGTFVLADDPNQPGGDVCGGTMEVLMDLWRPRELDRALLDRIHAAQQAGRPVTVATLVGLEGTGLAASPGDKLLVDDAGVQAGNLDLAGGTAEVVAAAQEVLTTGRFGVRIFRFGTASAYVLLEPILPSPTLLIVGAGHIAGPLAKLGRLLDFRVVVLDDRPMFATQERFPEADEVIAADFTSTLARYPITSSTYIVLVTRGHEHDEAGLRVVLDSPARYIGMIGSKRRVMVVFERVLRDGFDPEKLARVHAPIGLDIGARTPEEVGIAVAAEIVALRRSG